MFVARNIGELCNGSTADSDSACWGSNPYSPAKKLYFNSTAFLLSFVAFFFYLYY